MIQYFFLALRWRFLCDGIIGLDSFYYVTSIHNMTNNLMPMRTGELIYPYLLKRYFNVGLGDSTAYLIYARIFDLIAMGVFFFFSILLTRDKITLFFGDIKAESLRFLLYLVILVAAVGVIYWIFSKITESKKAEERYLLRTLKNGFSALSEGMKKVGIIKKFFVLFLMSLAVFLSRYTFFMFALATFGIELSFTQAVIVATAPILAAVFPVQGIGGYGTIETGWVLGFMLIGLDKELTLMAGFGTHSLRLLFSIVLAGISFPLLILKKRKRTK